MLVEIQGVSRRFGPLRALDGVRVDFASGSRTALIGPNGSGKSTLVRILLGLLGREGDVRVGGLCPLTQRRLLAPRVAYVPQVAPRLQATVAELARAVAGLRGTTVERFAECAQRLHLDLEAGGRKPFRTLSGGMRQKLLAPFALGAGAEFLVLDEPTASMDAESRERFFDMVQALEPQPTLLLCSHRFEEIRSLVDDVALLEEGRLVRHGPVADLIAANGRSIVEVLPSSGDAAGLLEALGFERRPTSWWHSVVRSSERGVLVARLCAALGADLVDIVVRDVEESMLLPVPAVARDEVSEVSVVEVEG